MMKLKEKANVIKSNFPFSTKLIYGLGEFPATLIISIINFFLMKFCTDYLGIAPIWAGVITFSGVFFDAITDPYIGYLSDKSKSKFGRRRSFMLKWTVPLAISVILLFCLPTLAENSSQFLKVSILFVLYLLYILLITCYHTPYGTIASDITHDYDVRTSLAAYRTVFIIIATLVSVILPDFFHLSNVTGASGNGFRILGLVMGALVAVFGLVSAFFLKEKPIENKETKFSFKKYFVDSMKVRPFRLVCFNYLFTNLCLTTINLALTYYLTSYIELPRLFTPIAGTVVILAMLFVPLFAFISKKKSKKFAQNLGAILMMVGLFILLFIPRRGLSSDGITTSVAPGMIDSLKLFPWYGYIAVVLIGFGFGSFEMIPHSLMPDAIDFCITKEEKNEGAYHGVVSFMFKVGKSIPNLLLGLALQVTQYIKPNETVNAATDLIMHQTDLARAGIAFVFIGLPFIFSLASILILRKYDVDRKKLQERVKETEGEIVE